jgi:sugar phosphate isomerase/epimerase
MKLAFSTLGCPNWPLDQIIASARSLGYDGVEFRTYLGSTDLLQQLPDPAQVRRQFAEAGLEIPCLDSSVTLAAANSSDQLAAGKAYLDLAASLGAPFLRVFGGMPPAGEPHSAALSRLGSVFSELAAQAEGKGVTVLLETHDHFATGQRAAEALALVPSGAAGALWDVHHPYRNGEPPAETLRLIGRRLGFVHFKDARAGGQLVLPGKGDLPLREFVSALKRIGYEGFISFEWEKAWHPDLPEPEVAFPAFIELLRPLLS